MSVRTPVQDNEGVLRRIGTHPRRSRDGAGHLVSSFPATLSAVLCGLTCPRRGQRR